MSARRFRPSRAAALAAALFFALQAAAAAWIPLKAALAQHLVERSWRLAGDGAAAPPPWPWADTHAVAVLEVPRLGIRQFVLAGASGRNLAFGPVLGGQGADRIVSGHRDTHFRFLAELRDGDVVRWTDASGSRTFEVRQREVVDSRARELALDAAVERLSLVTCYPFDSPGTGGPLRYVVTALPEPGGAFRPRSPASG